MARVSRRRTGPGEIVPRRYELEAAQRRFFAALWELVPEAMELLRSVAWLYSLDVGGGHGPNRERAELVLMRWREIYRLTGLECSHPHRYLPKTPRIQPVSVYEGRDRRRVIAARDEGAVKLPEHSTSVMKNGTVRDSDSYAILIADLLYEDPEGRKESPEDADIGDFDPRGETIDQAISRLLPEFETRLRYALQNIVEQDAGIGDGVPTRALPSRRHFEWSIRYQVKGETFRHIATSEGLVESRYVSKAVRSVAELIGLTLRERDKGGRPRQEAPARSARCIAIPHAGKTPVPVNGHDT